jgi:hypothetical protein
MFYRRHSGRDCRNPEHRDVKTSVKSGFITQKLLDGLSIAIHAFWISAHAETAGSSVLGARNPCRDDDLCR